VQFFLKHILKLTIFGTYNLHTFKHNTLINELLLTQFYLFNIGAKLHHRKWQKLRVSLFRTFSTSVFTSSLLMLFFVQPFWKLCYKLPSIVNFTFIQNFDQNFVFFTERRLIDRQCYSVIFKICVIFGVLFERRKVDKKANLHKNWSSPVAGPHILKKPCMVS